MQYAQYYLISVLWCSKTPLSNFILRSFNLTQKYLTSALADLTTLERNFWIAVLPNILAQSSENRALLHIHSMSGFLMDLNSLPSSQIWSYILNGNHAKWLSWWIRLYFVRKPLVKEVYNQCATFSPQPRPRATSKCLLPASGGVKDVL